MKNNRIASVFAACACIISFTVLSSIILFHVKLYHFKTKSNDRMKCINYLPFLLTFRSLFICFISPNRTVANETIIELQKLPHCDYEALKSLSKLYTKLALSIQLRMKSQSDIIDMDRSSTELVRSQKQSEIISAIDLRFTSFNSTDYGNS